MRASFFSAVPALLAAISAATACDAQAPAQTPPQTQKPAVSSAVPVFTGYHRPADAELRKKLTPIQYSVTRRDDTEMPFRNEYFDNHEPGIYVDIISGEPLFSSLEKYDSGTGWPSFYKPLEPGNLKTKTDYKLGYPRTEVRSKLADSHLGHLFDDGPNPTGLRYCMNSAALRFVPVARLQAEGYGKYLPLFTKAAKK
jgi:peptide-methionine (R)-S-oxide reductase/peptide methionine sulfoxide reductase msrA/msrB